ncbi:uncharacterized protein I303_108106 [Kwoniella dejecticola CBS 10117]|uniref:Phosphatidate cytidylyltransferase n=1 Tax=Kwoniella dejecticola CBS 10117 TaxID=1296121 RepID=A0A1A5ZWJ6_9TREE|nr:uncharacterized protein I303_08097 [Kwoniella dejecticola CBS 10117]OBR82183.1 hypothetical protein I303_08097 [Kwoniella dejecticola CBS 10117]
MAQAIPASSPPPISDRLPSRSPRPASRRTRSRSSISASLSPGPGETTRVSLKTSSESKENESPKMMNGNAAPSASASAASKGKTPEVEILSSRPQTWRDGSLEPSDDNSNSNSNSGVRLRKNPPRSARPSGAGANETLHTLPTIPDPQTEEDDSALDTSSIQQDDVHTSHPPPPPAASTQTGTGDRPVMTRKRRSSSVKRKPSPGVTPTKAVDWEIPRKTLHSSIGFLTLFLNYVNPPTLKPLITVLSSALLTVTITDFFRLRFPLFAEIWESYLGFLMRESERNKINGVVWYLVGVIWVLGLYPRDVAVVSILTLSWSDTTASTIGRLWGKYTKPLPANFPGLKILKFAPRKSLAGFLAASVTGFLIGISFWWNGSGGRWIVLDVEDWGHGYWGLWVTAAVVGIGGAVVEALDLGVDDNLTLPILSGALIWAWLAVTNFLLK